MKNIYNKPILNYFEIYPVSLFVNLCKNGSFKDFHGWGYPVKNNYYADIPIFPSKLNLIPKDATHILWVDLV